MYGIYVRMFYIMIIYVEFDWQEEAGQNLQEIEKGIEKKKKTSGSACFMCAMDRFREAEEEKGVVVWPQSESFPYLEGSLVTNALCISRNQRIYIDGR